MSETDVARQAGQSQQCQQLSQHAPSSFSTNRLRHLANRALAGSRPSSQPTHTLYNLLSHFFYLVDTKSVFMRLLTLWKAHNLPATLRICHIIKIINVMLKIDSKQSSHSFHGQSKGAGAMDDSTVAADIDSWLRGGCPHSPVVAAPPTHKHIYIYIVSHRVSCINVCSLLYCPCTPPFETYMYVLQACLLHPCAASCDI